MELQRKFEIAVLLLESVGGIKRLREGTPEYLQNVAGITHVPLSELRAFAEEVAGRIAPQAQMKAPKQPQPSRPAPDDEDDSPFPKRTFF